MAENDSDESLPDASSFLDRFQRKAAEPSQDTAAPEPVEIQDQDVVQREASVPQVQDDLTLVEAADEDQDHGSKKTFVSVQIPSPPEDLDRSQYVVFKGSTTIKKILGRSHDRRPLYKVRYGDNHVERVSTLFALRSLEVRIYNTSPQLRLSLIHAPSKSLPGYMHSQ